MGHGPRPVKKTGASGGPVFEETSLTVWLTPSNGAALRVDSPWRHPDGAGIEQICGIIGARFDVQEPHSSESSYSIYMCVCVLGDNLTKISMRQHLSQLSEAVHSL